MFYRPVGFFDGVFFSKDADVSVFVDYIHGTTGHVILILYFYILYKFITFRENCFVQSVN